MSVDTKGLTIKKITQDDIYNFIHHTFDKEAKLYFDKPRDNLDNGSGSISFKDGREQRLLFFILDSQTHEYGFISSATYNYLSLSCWGSSVSTMQRLIAYLGGGWIDENDCDDEGFYKIPASNEGAVPHIIRMTQAELNEKMGGVVVITE